MPKGAEAGSFRKGDLDGQEDVKTSGGSNRVGRGGEQQGLEGRGVENELSRSQSVRAGQYWTPGRVKNASAHKSFLSSRRDKTWGPQHSEIMRALFCCNNRVNPPGACGVCSGYQMPGVIQSYHFPRSPGFSNKLKIKYTCPKTERGVIYSNDREASKPPASLCAVGVASRQL